MRFWEELAPKFIGALGLQRVCILTSCVSFAAFLFLCLHRKNVLFVRGTSASCGGMSVGAVGNMGKVIQKRVTARVGHRLWCRHHVSDGSNTKTLLLVCGAWTGGLLKHHHADLTSRPPAMSSHLSVVLGINSSFGKRRRRAQVDSSTT